MRIMLHGGMRCSKAEIVQLLRSMTPQELVRPSFVALRVHVLTLQPCPPLVVGRVWETNLRRPKQISIRFSHLFAHQGVMLTAPPQLTLLIVRVAENSFKKP